MRKLFILFGFIFLFGECAFAQPDTISINLDNVVYPYPVKFLHLKQEGQDIKMAYMDVKPNNPNGRAVILFHGKNFGGYYWASVIKALTGKGFRVIVPDQVGFGKSDKAYIHYSFHSLAGIIKCCWIV